MLHLKYEKISVLKQHAAASIYLLTRNDPTRHITFLDIKFAESVFGWELKFISLTSENNAIFSSHCFTLRERRNSAIELWKGPQLKDGAH